MLIFLENPHFFDEIVMDYQLDDNNKGDTFLEMAMLDHEWTEGGLFKKGVIIRPNSANSDYNEILTRTIEKLGLTLA